MIWSRAAKEPVSTPGRVAIQTDPTKHWGNQLAMYNQENEGVETLFYFSDSQFYVFKLKLYWRHDLLKRLGGGLNKKIFWGLYDFKRFGGFSISVKTNNINESVIV